MNSFISIIIRSYNEEQLIRRCLTAIYSQKVDYPIEVIVVDSGSTDKTLELASKFPVKTISVEQERFSYGRSLNLGCQAAKGKYLVLLSAHAIPQNSTWIQSLINNFDNPKIAGVFSKQIPLEDCNPLSERQILAHWNDKRKDLITRFGFTASGAVILKDVWQKTKFNEGLIASEDYDWAIRVKAQGYIIAYEPRASIYHSHNENFQQTYNRYFREMYTTLLINGEKFSLNLLTLGAYHFFCDMVYIIRNKHNLLWIAKSAANNALLFLAAGRAILKRLSI
ncbi:hypothetical protein D1AOALGA4SA_2125 [Olavius algarvensis Delta 1 endosymbiont]|nr:hypothetical protein D1AOALGA4SA_2125 [Olavius algarvensis Delta 1 endosymbiont]